MPTPQITLRVGRDRHQRWKQAAILCDTSVSEQIRAEMDDWADRILEQPIKPAPTPPTA